MTSDTRTQEEARQDRAKAQGLSFGLLYAPKGMGKSKETMLEDWKEQIVPSMDKQNYRGATTKSKKARAAKKFANSWKKRWSKNHQGLLPN